MGFGADDRVKLARLPVRRRQNDREQSRAGLLANRLDATAAMIFEQSRDPTFILTKPQISEMLRRDALDHPMRRILTLGA